MVKRRKEAHFTKIYRSGIKHIKLVWKNLFIIRHSNPSIEQSKESPIGWRIHLSTSLDRLVVLVYGGPDHKNLRSCIPLEQRWCSCTQKPCPSNLTTCSRPTDHQFRIIHNSYIKFHNRVPHPEFQTRLKSLFKSRIPDTDIKKADLQQLPTE